MKSIIPYLQGNAVPQGEAYILLMPGDKLIFDSEALPYRRAVLSWKPDNLCHHGGYEYWYMQFEGERVSVLRCLNVMGNYAVHGGRRIPFTAYKGDKLCSTK